MVSKYTPFSEREDYDWAIVPFDEYLQGFGDDSQAPLIATRGVRRAIQEYQFGPLFSTAIKRTGTGDGVLPEGEWKSTLAARFERTIYILSAPTTAKDDAAIVEAFNSAANRSQFNFFYRNCSDQAKAILRLGRPSMAPLGDRLDGVTMETPKGLAKALVERALAEPDFRLTIQKITQLPGTFPRSREVLFPLENLYKSRGYWPYWFFEGFREVASVAIVYHQIGAPFSLPDASEDFISPRASELTREQDLVRQLQDVYRDAVSRVSTDQTTRARISALNVSANERLRTLRREKDAEIARVAGSAEQWRELGREFRAVRSTIHWAAFANRDIAANLDRAGHDAVADELLDFFEAHGSVTIDSRHGVRLAVPLADGQVATTGLSESEILTGDARVAALVLTAVVDYNLHQRADHRDTGAHVNTLMHLLREAVAAVASRDS